MTNEERVEFLRQSIESHDRQIGEPADKLAIQTANIDRLVAVTNRDATAIRTLARLAELH